MAPRRSVLVGRDSELAALRRALDEVRGGGSFALGVRGEPGIGKSRLLLELAGRAEEAGMLVLSGRAAELERDLPFALVADALDARRLDDGRLAAGRAPAGKPTTGRTGASEGFTAALLADLPDQDAAELGAAVPTFGPLPGTRPAVSSGERHRVATAVRALLERLARDRTVVVLLDDVHWADPASVDVLTLLLHRPPQGSVLLALAARSGRAHALDAALNVGLRDGRGEIVDLGPLTPEAAAQLTPDISGLIRDQLYADSGGNPFYLEELARAAKAHRVAHGAGELTGVPAAVRGALLGELHQLPESARLVLEGAAVAGDPFEPDLAAAAANLPESDVLAGLDTLQGQDLVRPTGQPRRFRFRHPLVRRAVYEASGGGWLLAAHARVAEALREIGAVPAQRALHVERSSRPGDLDSVDLLARAAREVETFAPATAAGWYEAANRLLPDEARHDARRLELLQAQGAALATAGQPMRARDVLRRVVALMRSDGSAARLAVVEQLAQLEGMWTNNPDAARELLEAERAALGEGRSWQHAALTLALARGRATVCDHAEAMALAEEARSLANAVGDRVLEADAAAQAADSAHCALRLDDPVASAAADRRIADAAKLIDALSDEQLSHRQQMRFWLGVARFFTGDLVGAHSEAQRGLELARRTRHGLLAPSYLALRGIVDEELGRLDAAEAAAQDVLDNAIVSNNPQLGLWGALLASRVALARGRVDQAIGQGEAAWEFYGTDPGSAAGWTLADARLAAGDPEGAAAALEAFGWVHPGLWTRDRVRGVDVTVRVLLERGLVEEARAWADRAVAEAGGRRDGTFAGIHARIQASVLRARGDLAAAARVALEGANAADAAGTPLWAGHCRTLAGEALAAQGRIEEARTELRLAAAQLGELGAFGFRDAALSVLRRLGDRPRVPIVHSGREGGDRLASLTAREREVAILVGEGNTNATIARRLHLSERTVEKHVSSVLSKLGMTSRASIIRLITVDGVQPDA